MKLVQRTSKFVAMMLMGAMMIASTPRPAHAMVGCADEQPVTVTAPSLSHKADNEWGAQAGIFTGVAEKTSTGLLYDTYTYVAYDMMSGNEITGTFQVSTAKCLAQASGIMPVVPATHVTIDSYTKISQ